MAAMACASLGMLTRVDEDDEAKLKSLEEEQIERRRRMAEPERHPERITGHGYSRVSSAPKSSSLARMLRKAKR